MKILLTGQPGVGKSTIVTNVVEKFSGEIFGTIGREMRNDSGERVGFEAVTLDQRTRTFAHTEKFQDSPYAIENFYVDVTTFDDFVVPELQLGINKSQALVIIDEIGRMQSFSELYMQTVRELFQSNTNVLATIVYDDEPWSREFKENSEAILTTVTSENRELLPDVLITIYENTDVFYLLSSAQQAHVITLLREYLQKNSFIQAKKLFFNAIPYVIDNKIRGLEASEVKAAYLVEGKTKKHRVIQEGSIFQCDCDLFNGIGEYNGKQAECSHIMALKIANIR